MERGVPEIIAFGFAMVLPQMLVSLVKDKLISAIIFIPVIAMIYILLKKEQRRQENANAAQ